jgi:hypothetical protein
MKNVLIIFFLFVLSLFSFGCNTAQDNQTGQAEAPPALLPSSGDYTFQRFIEEKEHTEYRVLYSQVPDSNIVQVKTVQAIDSSDATEIAETNNFYEEFNDGIYGYVVLSEEFPAEWTERDIKGFAKTKIISYPLEVGNEWTESLEDVGIKITYHIRSIDTVLETADETFEDCIVIDFEEKDENGNTLRKGNSAFAPQIGWIRHEITEEVLKDVHKLIKINER